MSNENPFPDDELRIFAMAWTVIPSGEGGIWTRLKGTRPVRMEPDESGLHSAIVPAKGNFMPGDAGGQCVSALNSKNSLTWMQILKFPAQNIRDFPGEIPFPRSRGGVSGRPRWSAKEVC